MKNRILALSLFLFTSYAVADNPSLLWDTFPPQRVSLSARTLQVNQIHLRWNASMDDFSSRENITYLLYRAELHPRQFFSFALVASLQGVTEFQDMSLPRRGHYIYYVVAQDEAGNRSPTSWVVNVSN